MSIKQRLFATTIAASLLSTTAYASVIDRPFFQSLGVVIVWGATDFGSNGATNEPVVSDFILLTPASGTAGADLISGDVYSVVTGKLDPVTGDSTATTHFSTPSDINPITGQTSGGVFTDAGTGLPYTANGSNDGVLDAADTLTAFGIDSSTDVGTLAPGHKSSFYVASNAPFDIFAQSSNTLATGDFLTDGMDDSNISFAMSIQSPGLDWTASGLLPFGANAQDPSVGGAGVIASIDSLDDLSSQSKVFDGGQKTAASNGSITQQSVRFDSAYQLDTDSAAAGIQGYDFSVGVGTLQSDVTYTVFVP